jgi:hypothetical protein
MNMVVAITAQEAAMSMGLLEAIQAAPGMA